MSVSALANTAGEVMDRCAILMNDPNKTDYTYVVMLPYLNMAIDELNEHLEESNHPMTNQVFPWGTRIMAGVHSAIVNPPPDLVEIQQVGERPAATNAAGTTVKFRPLPRREFTEALPPTDSLIFWCWKDQQIKFNELGATINMDVEVRYIRKAIGTMFSEDQEIGMVNVIPYLSYKTAAMLAMFVGENSSRAEILNDQADGALERVIAISNKGNQQMMTRHRPFRAAWKMRGY